MSKSLVVRLDYQVVPEHDVVLPPLSSKVMKYAVLSKQLLPLEEVDSLVRSRDKNKPLFMSNLKLGGRALVSEGKEITVKAGSPLMGTLGFLHRGELDPGEIPWEKKVETPYGTFSFSLSGIQVLEVDSLVSSKEEVQGNILLKFVSPAIMSSKAFIPPSLKERFRRFKSGYLLLPPIGLVLGYAYKTYCSALSMVDSQHCEVNTYRYSVLFTGLSSVFGFRLRPVTVVVGNDNKGNLRKTRGVTGWVEFDIVHPKYKAKALKFLKVASFLGLGKSRGIGFGEVEVTVKPP